MNSTIVWEIIKDKEDCKDFVLLREKLVKILKRILIS